MATIGLSGQLSAKKIPMDIKAPLIWKIKNTLRYGFLKGLVINKLGRGYSWLTGTPVLTGTLRAAKIVDGQRIDYGIVSYLSVTTAFCELMVDQLIAESSLWGDFKHHDSGIGTTAENVTDTDMETTDGESRVTGTQVENTSVIYESVGTITYTSTKAITEHGLFNAATGVTLMDRSVFSAINVVNTNAIQWTYDLTCTAGG